MIFFDVECYLNYFYVRFLHQNGRVYDARLFNDTLETGNRDTIARFMSKETLIGFNSDNYDLPMIAAFLGGATNSRLKKLSDRIIQSSEPWWVLSKEFPDVVCQSVDSIDLMGATPLRASLKTYACRIHSSKIEDLPIQPGALITRENIAGLETYCANDLSMTADVYNAVSRDIDLREKMSAQYSTDFRSKSGPQIAESVLRSTLAKTGVVVKKRTGSVEPFKFLMPDFIRFETDELNAVKKTVADAVFTVSTKVKLPAELNVAIEFDGALYKFGIGGLHSQEKRQAVMADGEFLGELDVASMYPSIILGQGLYPAHIGPEFCAVYRAIFDERMAAKNSGDKLVSESLKLVLNSSFGKFGSEYSFLYSPELLIQTTISGQLALLMLIEMLSLAGIKTYSANTDGVVVKHAGNAISVVQRWEARTGWKLEWTPYDAIYSESVNNYVAVKPGGGVKLKGTYAPPAISKGYQNQICVDAVVEYLAEGTPLVKTVYECQDIRKFLTMRGVKGGGNWRGQTIGRVARWYRSLNGEPILYTKNGNKVAGSDSAGLMLNLGPVPVDLDRDWYIARAEVLLHRLGVNNHQGNFF